MAEEESGTVLTAEAEAKPDEEVKAGEEVKAAEKISADADKDKEAADAGKDPDKDKAAAEADKPIEYADFNVPDGMQVDKDALADFLPLAQEEKLSQEQAQKYIDVFAKGAERAAKEQANAWAGLKKTWVAEAKADKEIGGDRFDESARLGNLAVKKLGTPELGRALETTGLGDHPEMIRFFARVGKIVTDDNFNFGSVSGEQPKSRAEIMFPTQGQ